MDPRTILIFLLLFTALVFVHELGHFITAKLTGMRVLEFGIGFPPRLAVIRRGGVDYSMNWIPIGGFVRILGEDGVVGPGGELPHDAFAARPIPARALVLTAGVLMNVLLAVVVYAVIFLTGVPTFEGKLRWDVVEEGSPAEAAGMRDGDVIASIDGKKFLAAQDMINYIWSRAGQEIAIGVERDDRPLGDLKAVPRVEPPPGQGPLGLRDPKPVREIVRHSPGESIVLALERTGVVLGEIVRAFGRFIGGVVGGAPGGGDEVAGPIGIFNLTREVVEQGPAVVLELLALLSLNLAILNIVPFPGLDGGRLLFVLIEAARGGRRLDPRTEAAIHAVGFMMLLFLVVVVSFFDVRRLVGG